MKVIARVTDDIEVEVDPWDVVSEFLEERNHSNTDPLHYERAILTMISNICGLLKRIPDDFISSSSSSINASVYSGLLEQANRWKPQEGGE